MNGIIHIMQVIRITINPELLKLVDKECGGRNRSAFFREAAQEWLKQRRIRKLEQKQKDGYARYPVKPGEFDKWVAEQVWPQ